MPAHTAETAGAELKLLQRTFTYGSLRDHLMTYTAYSNGLCCTRVLASHLVSLCLLLTSGAGAYAKPQPSNLAVLPVINQAQRKHPVSTIFKGVGEAVRTRNIRAMSVDDYFFQDGRELSKQARSCGEDTQCLARVMSTFQADLGLVVLVDQQLKPPLLALLLLDTQNGKALAEHYGSLTKKNIDLQIKTHAEQLFEVAGYLQTGQLSIRVQPSSASLYVKDVLKAPGRHTFPVGVYTIRAHAPNHHDLIRDIRLKGGDILELDLKLKPEKRSLLKSPWFWIGVGVVVVAAGVATGVSAASQGSTPCLCIESSMGEDCFSCR